MVGVINEPWVDPFLFIGILQPSNTDILL
jgi:hypothetical protein